MGSPEGEEGRYVDEGPVHEVEVPAFLLSKTECTQTAWKKGEGEDRATVFDAHRPVGMVTWMECHDWCAKNDLRLPGEAEWEYACRAGTRTRFSFGDSGSELDRYAWFLSNSGKQVHEVAGKPPNPWGLHDMHGNAWEWCADLFGPYPGATPEESSGATFEYRVIRSGCRASIVEHTRSAARHCDVPEASMQEIGFRPAADLPE